MPDAKIADRQTLRLQWSSPKREPQRKLDSDEIATMLKRGEALFESGDIAGARLLLQRAAEGGSEEAAMAVAATYDPGVMRNLGVRGVEADVEKARYWYEKARQYGSKEAPKRLESLASQSR
jgi:TPR repeat protein